MKRRVYLHGHLGKKFGTEPIELDVDTPQMLNLGLDCAFPGFKQALRESHEIALVKKHGEQIIPLDEDSLQLPFGTCDEIHLAASEQGSGTGAEWVASYFAEAGTYAWYAYYVATYILITLAIGKAVQALSTQPSTSDGGARADQRPSYLYNGAVNVIEQGYPVPLVYGRHMVGSVVISAYVAVEELPT